MKRHRPVVVLALALVVATPLSGARAQDDDQGLRPGNFMRSLIERLRGQSMPAGLVKSNGRIEATQVDVAAKYGGRIETLAVNEGDEVTAGEVVGKIASPEYEAQLRQAQANVLKAKQALAEALALIAQRKSDLDFARTDLERGQTLVARGNITQQIVDQRRNKYEAAQAADRAAQAQREQAQFAIEAAEAEVQRLEAVIVDLTLVSPRTGRVQYRLARAGEVVAPGQRILTILDLQDVYMTIYLPAADAGKLTLEDEARIIADPVPEYVIPAKVSFVATDAQFTPKSVETADEREKLMFRVKLQIDPKVLEKYHRQVKTGVRGVGFVRLSPKVEWPADLQVKLPQ
ncbi:HlyD family secretion protein [Methylocella sp.]|uniref:HlyD family secretion protein n=1 Tax=Methylocella sp. TaxID=1978226 RepID=UPI0037839009